VEEGHDVLHAMLWSYQQWVVEAIDGSSTSPKIRLNMLLIFRGYGVRSRSVVCGWWIVVWSSGSSRADAAGDVDPVKALTLPSFGAADQPDQQPTLPQTPAFIAGSF
jgi:hypothetical protein